MLWIFVLAITIAPITMSAGEKLTGKAGITWDHAVNSRDKLKASLASGVQMIEADVVLGKYTGNGTVFSLPNEQSDASKPGVRVGPNPDDGDENLPIMAHPPHEESDLSLQAFLDTVTKHNAGLENDKKKGIKLDFKTIEALQRSEDVLKHYMSTANFEVWINADILSGPVKSETTPVDPVKFFNVTKKLSGPVLSIGWTTKWSSTANPDASYTKENVDEMIKTINNNDIAKDTKITFPVRAGIAAQSKDNLKKLFDQCKEKYNTTFTIWSSEGDWVEVGKLKEFINEFKEDKVYVDVPQGLKEAVENSASSLVQFGLLNAAAFAFVLLFRNGLH